jgi:hypothetical protein
MPATDLEKYEQIVRICKRDFLKYAPLALKIRAKDGSIIPFELNTAQLYLHQQLEQQKKRPAR